VRNRSDVSKPVALTRDSEGSSAIHSGEGVHRGMVSARKVLKRVSEVVRGGGHESSDWCLTRVGSNGG
jgi:hypothetical protein